jgi:hypothetical protein
MSLSSIFEYLKLLKALKYSDLRCYDEEIDVDSGIPDDVVWLVKNLYISTGTIYISGEVVVCG